MKLSVIVPIYNSEKFLNKCIDSLLKQSYVNIEIILVNDGSTDSSLLICEKFQRLNGNIIIINKKNEGVVAAYLDALKICKGDYLGFIDSDDYIKDDFYEKLMQEVVENGYDIVACGAEKIYPDGHIFNETIPDFSSEKIIFDSDMLSEMKKNFFNSKYCEYFKLYRCNKVFKKEIIYNNLIYMDRRIRIFEDNLFTIPCLLDASKVCYINSALYCYVQHKSSAMRSFSLETINKNDIVLEIINKIFNDKCYFVDLNIQRLEMAAFSIVKILDSNLKRKDKIAGLQCIRDRICFVDIYEYKDIFSTKTYYTLCKIFKGKIKYLLFVYKCFRLIKRKKTF